MDILDQNLSALERKNLYEDSEQLMLWHCRSDPRFSYYVYIPESIYEKEPPLYKIVCIVHGTARSTEDYRQAYREFKGVRYDLILLSMIDELSRKYRIYKDKFFMSGFSGGGQFAQRFFYLHPKRLMGLCIGAPGRITYINDKVDYYWGTRDFNKIFDKEIEIEAMKNVPVQLLIGEKDVSFIGESPYGSNRMERMMNLKKNLEEHDIEVQLDIMEGIAHSGYDNIKSKYQTEFFQKILDKDNGQG